MRSFVLFLLVGASALAQERAGPSIDPAKRAAIEDLLSLMKADQITGQILTQVEQATKPQIEKIPGTDRRSDRYCDILQVAGRASVPRKTAGSDLEKYRTGGQDHGRFDAGDPSDDGRLEREHEKEIWGRRRPLIQTGKYADSTGGSL